MSDSDQGNGVDKEKHEDGIPDMTEQDTSEEEIVEDKEVCT